jgi:hypothetical protein
MGEGSKALEPIVYEPAVSEAPREVDSTTSRAPWVVIIMALAVGALSVVVLLTDVRPDEPEPAPAFPRRTVETTVSCEVKYLEESQVFEFADPEACAYKATTRVNYLCADPTVEAVALNFLYPGTGRGRYGTSVCDDPAPIRGAALDGPFGSALAGRPAAS